jgi:hypothetical protein
LLAVQLSSHALQLFTVIEAFAAVEPSASAVPARIERIAPRITYLLIADAPFRAAVKSVLTSLYCPLLTVFFLADSRQIA